MKRTLRALGLACLVALPARAAVAPPVASTVVAFADLPDAAGDDFAAALGAFRVSCAAVLGGTAPSRTAVAPPPALRGACRRAMALPAAIGRDAARAFFAGNFTPRRLDPPAFLTGYYEPVVEGSPVRTAAFATPLLAAPAGLTTGGAGSPATYRRPDGTQVPVPDRAGIEAGGLGAAAPTLVWLREPVDAFFVAVQGSARIAMPDGRMRRIAYAARNGYPYTSIGKVLVATLGIAPERMGMAELRGWIRANGQGPEEAGTALMRRNRSYIFFRFDDSLPPGAGPVGAAGVSLTPLRSLAIDHSVWPYGLPFYLAVDLPGPDGGATPLRRLMVAQDTGAAILGPARADIFFGTGSVAAARAGAIRQPGTLFVLWPKDGPDRDGAVPEAARGTAQGAGR